MKKDSNSVFFDLCSKLQKRLDELEEVNYDLCQCSQGFAALNSNTLSFLSHLKRIEKDENNLLFQINSTNKNDGHDKIFRTKDDFIMNYTQLSSSLSEFISSFACKTLCDQYTTSKVQEIRNRFIKITDMIKDMNYRIKFSHQNQMIPSHISNSVLIEFHKVKTKLEASHFVQKVNESSNYNAENIESLNKFYVSLEPIKDRLLEKISSLKATQDDSKIYQKYPSPKILGSYSEFSKYIKTNSKLKNAFDNLFSILRPYYVKIQRKQQQIDSIVSDLSSISSEMYKTLKCLEDETDRLTNVECIYRKISVIDNSQKSYQFFEPEFFIDYILKFIDDEKNFFKEVDNCIKYSKSQPNSSSNSALSSSASVVVNDNVESRLSIAHQQELLGIFTDFHKLIIKTIKLFDENDIFNRLEDKLKKKAKLEVDFPTKYPRADSSPEQTLLAERKHFGETIKSVNCAFECINTDILKTISELTAIKVATTAFTGIHNFLKAEGSHFEDIFLFPASRDWVNQVADEFKLEIHNKKKEIEKVKKQYEIEKRSKEYGNCCHPKTICLTSCGHTFCDKCLNFGAISAGSYGICPKCQKEFSQNDIIQIKW